MLLRAASQAENAYSYVIPLGSVKKFFRILLRVRDSDGGYLTKVRSLGYDH